MGNNLAISNPETKINHRISSSYKILEKYVLPDSNLAACHSKANSEETSVGWKGEIALFMRPASWEEGGLVAKNQLSRFCLTVKVCKERKGEIITVNHLGRGSESFIIHCVQIFFWLVGGEVTGQCPRNLVLR